MANWRGINTTRTELFKAAINTDGTPRSDIEAVPVGAAGLQADSFLTDGDGFGRITLHPMSALTGGNPTSLRVNLDDNTGGGPAGATTADRLLCGFYDYDLNLLGNHTFSFTAAAAAQVLAFDVDIDLSFNYLISLVAYDSTNSNYSTQLALLAFDSHAFVPGAPIGTVGGQNYVLGWVSAFNFNVDVSAAPDPFVINASISHADQLTIPFINLKG